MWKKHLHTRSVCRRNCILAWTSMFTASDDISRMPICPAYRGSSLGTGWRIGSQHFRVPERLSSHASYKLRVQLKWSIISSYLFLFPFSLPFYLSVYHFFFLTFLKPLVYTERSFNNACTFFCERNNRHWLSQPANAVSLLNLVSWIESVLARTDRIGPDVAIWPIVSFSWLCARCLRKDICWVIFFPPPSSTPWEEPRH